MKSLFDPIRLTTAITLLAGSLALLGQGNPATDAVEAAATKHSAPRIHFSETVFDFGKAKPADTLRHDFIFTNTGNATLEVTGVQPGCGCTTAGAWDRQIEPGKTGKIPIQLNPSSFSGSIAKLVTVTCNDPVQATYQLQVRAAIWRPIDVQPSYVQFVMIDDEQVNPPAQVVHIVNNLDEPISLEASSGNQEFNTKLNTVRPGKEFELQVTYTKATANPGPQANNITIKTSAADMPVLNITAYAMTQPAIMVMPGQIQLPAGPINPSQRYTAMIRNNGRSPIKISDPSLNIEGVAVEVQEIEAGKVFTLTFGLPAGFQTRTGQAIALTVKTTHPKYPLVKVTVTRAPLATSAAVGVPVPVETGAK